MLQCEQRGDDTPYTKEQLASIAPSPSTDKRRIVNVKLGSSLEALDNDELLAVYESLTTRGERDVIETALVAQARGKAGIFAVRRNIPPDQLVHSDEPLDTFRLKRRSSTAMLCSVLATLCSIVASTIQRSEKDSIVDGRHTNRNFDLVIITPQGRALSHSQ